MRWFLSHRPGGLRCSPYFSQLAQGSRRASARASAPASLRQSADLGELSLSKSSPARIALLVFVVALLWQVQRELGLLSSSDDSRD